MDSHDSIPWPPDFPEVVFHTTIERLKRHPDFMAAKAGDMDSANRVVAATIHEGRITTLARRFPDAMIASVHTEELWGRNKLPRAYAVALSVFGDLEINTDIVQISAGGHTGADAATRMMHRSLFDGRVEPGRNYILVDDVVTQGGTLSDLRQFIEHREGRVVAASTVAASFSLQMGPSKVLAIQRETVLALEGRFGRVRLEGFLHENNLVNQLEALTNSEGNYLRSFSSLDAIRSRFLEARLKEVDAGRSRVLPESPEAAQASLTFASGSRLAWTEEKAAVKPLSKLAQYLQKRGRGYAMEFVSPAQGLEPGED